MDVAGELRLLALAPSGETYIVEIGGRTWLVQPPGAGGSRVVDETVVERAVSEHGFDRVDRVFHSAEDLDAYRNEVAARIAPEFATRPESYDADDVRRLLVVAKRWRANRDPRGVPLVRSLLQTPVVATNAELLSEIAALLDPGPPDLLTSRPPSEIGRAARERFRAPAVAA